MERTNRNRAQESANVPEDFMIGFFLEQADFDALARYAKSRGLTVEQAAHDLTIEKLNKLDAAAVRKGKRQ